MVAHYFLLKAVVIRSCPFSLLFPPFFIVELSPPLPVKTIAPAVLTAFSSSYVSLLLSFGTPLVSPNVGILAFSTSAQCGSSGRIFLAVLTILT